MKCFSFRAVILAVLVLPLASWGLETSVTYTSTSKVTLTPSSSVSSLDHSGWVVSGGDSSIALVEMKTSTSTSTKKPEVYVTPKANGTATWTVAYGSSGSKWTIKITVNLSGSSGTDDPVDPPTPSSLPNIFSVSPYVQHPTTNAMTVIFFTTKSCAATVKVWRMDGKGATNEQQTACVDVSTELAKNSSGDTETYAKQYKHRVRFENLRALTDYRYAVEPAESIAYTNVFRTLPDKNTPIRFIGYCDCETTPNGAKTTWSNNGGSGWSTYIVGLTEGFASNLVHIAARKPDLITISGDICAKGGLQKNWDEFWRQNAGFNAKKDGYNDLAGSIPILSTIGNHDLKDRNADTMSKEGGGEFALNKYLTYFEHNPNDVHYEYADGTTTKETRDLSQLFHREDLGPVTLIFIDTNKGNNGGTAEEWAKSTQTSSSRPAMRSPDFNPGSLQYTWLTNNLADAQRNSRFTFVINHHCPYSVGQHNRPIPLDGGATTGWNTGSGRDSESAQAVRVLTGTMMKYGVDGWLCGHDEIMEHSQTNGFEVLPDGTTRPHTLNIYDLGSGGDGLRGTKCVENPLEVFRAFENSGERWENGILKDGGCHYGFLEIDVTTNKYGKWQCSLTPRYDFIYNTTPSSSTAKGAGFELRAYKDRIIIDEESNQMIYEERLNQTFPSDYVEYVRPPQAADPVVNFQVTPEVQAPITGGAGVAVKGTLSETLSGATYTLLKQNAAGTFEGVDGAKNQTSADFTINETGLYKIQATVQGSTAESSATVGVLKYDAPTAVADQAEQTTVVAVPWAVTLDALLRPSDFTSVSAGTEWAAAIKAYDPTNKTYEMWTLLDGVWTPCTVVASTEAGKSVVSTSAAAASRALVPGGAVWVTRKNATQPFFLSAIYPTTVPAETTLVAGWNLVANPLLTTLDLNKAITGSEGDQIIVPSATGLGQTTYTYKDGSWGYLKAETVTYTVGGKSVTGVKNTWTPATGLPPGQGFWFVSGQSGKKINWAAGK